MAKVTKMIGKIFVCALLCAPHVLALLEIFYNERTSDEDPEQRLNYWRDDLGINLHHTHYHLVYPATGGNAVRKDRRGELFYYMHHQIMTRMNTERLCNGLNRAVPLDDFRQPLFESYYPQMNGTVAGYPWAARPANLTLSDINISSTRFTIADMERWRKNIIDAMKDRRVRQQGPSLYLDDKTGIDVLGNAIQSVSVLSPNYDFYGDLHNSMHVALAYIHDPDGRKSQPAGVILGASTATRDPIFYRWHSHLDNVFRIFKDNLIPYSKSQLSFRGVTVTNVSVSSTSSPNTLNTYWTTSDIVLSRGLDFNFLSGPIPARVTHLNHEAFSYIINAHNANEEDVMGTVRIFIAPRFDENHKLLNFNDQRFLMTEMDKFTVTLRPGENTITRQSTESTVTIPFESTFRDLNVNIPNGDDILGFSQWAYCGCGWPQHMLVPKGTKEGYPMDLFVMISDYEQDKVIQDEPDESSCRTGTSFCGLKDRKYPDAQAMGYPFDRRSIVNTMNQFRTLNMLVQQITVKFTDTIKPRE